MELSGFYPSAIESVVQRMDNGVARIENGELLEIAAGIGIDPEWVKCQYKRPIRLGIAEQPNLLTNIFSHYGRFGSPFALIDAVNLGRSIQNALGKDKSELTFLTLLWDVFAIDGDKFAGSFVFPDEEFPLINRNQRRKKWAGSPYSHVTVCKKDLYEMIDRIGQKSSLLNGFFTAFVTDLQIASLHCQRQGVSETISYSQFVLKLNTLLMGRVLDDDINYHALDNGSVLDTVMISGITHIETFVSKLNESGLFLPGDAVFRLLEFNDRIGSYKYIRLGLRKTENGGLEFPNLDYGMFKFGKETYTVEDLELARISPESSGAPTRLFAAKKPEYILLYSGLSNVLIMDDGVNWDVYNFVRNSLLKLGFDAPIIYSYNAGRTFTGYESFETDWNWDVFDYYRAILSSTDFKNENRK